VERRVGANARGRKEKDGFIHRTRRQEFEADNVLTSDFVQQEARLFRLRRNGMSTFWGPSTDGHPALLRNMHLSAARRQEETYSPHDGLYCQVYTSRKIIEFKGEIYPSSSYGNLSGRQMFRRARRLDSLN